MVVHPFLLRLAVLIRWKWLFIGTVLFLINAGALMTVMIYLSEQTPLSTFEQARLALSDARQAEAGRYVPGVLIIAEKQWQQARSAWQQETRKWVFSRDYKIAKELAEMSRNLSQQAARSAIAIKDSLRWRSAAQLTLVKQKIDAFRAQFTDLPIASKDRQRFVSGEILMMESELAFHRHDYLLSAQKIQLSATLVGSTNDRLTSLLQSYVAEIPKWQRMAEETIAWSKEYNAIAIVVDKLGYRCRIYDSGMLKAEFPIELGPKWLGHKLKRGDGATPEGKYRVIKKKDIKKSIYYKALEIDYPNETDLRRFREAQNRGEIPQSAHIGGSIEIHGEGGKGANWTSGCVAVTNNSMDKIFDLAEVGTPVTIVGALDGFLLLEKWSAVNGKMTKNAKNRLFKKSSL